MLTLMSMISIEVIPALSSSVFRALRKANVPIDMFAVNTQVMSSISPDFTKTTGVSTSNEARLRLTDKTSAFMATVDETKVSNIVNIRFMNQSFMM